MLGCSTLSYILDNNSIKTIWCWSTLTHLIFCIKIFCDAWALWLILYFASYFLGSWSTLTHLIFCISFLVMLEHFDSSYFLHQIFLWCWSTLTHLIFCIFSFGMLEHFDSSYFLHLIFSNARALWLILYCALLFQNWQLFCRQSKNTYFIW